MDAVQNALVDSIEAAFGSRTSKCIAQFVHDDFVCMQEADWINKHLRIRRWQDVPEALIRELEPELYMISPAGFRFLLPRMLTIAVSSGDSSRVIGVCMMLCFGRNKARLKEFYGSVVEPQAGVVLATLTFLIDRMKSLKAYDIRSDLQFLRSFMAKRRG